MAPIFRFPKPRSFLHIISLRTATEFITFTLAVNKVTGLYGILALFTGYHLNPIQLSHYIYSLFILGLACWLASAIRTRPENRNGVLKVLALVWVYALDTAVNSLYTLLFGMGWFVLLAQHLDEPLPLIGKNDKVAPGFSTINDTATFTNPDFPAVAKVDIVASPSDSLVAGQDAVAYGSLQGTPGSALFQSGSMASISILGLLWIIRVYFCIIVMAYARGLLRQYVASTSTSYSQSEDPSMAENPFRADREEGAGWTGKLARLMLRFPTARYWLGREESEADWARATSGRFEAGKGLKIELPVDGVSERERRARSGTGPPPLADKRG